MKADNGVTDRREIKRVFIMIGSLFLLVILILLSITSGVIDISIVDFFSGNLPEETKKIINNIRIPRVIIGALVGMNLAMAGAIMQGVLRNPLAAPSTLGVTSGAGLGAIVILILYPHQILYVPLVAFLGAILSLLIVYTLSWQNSQIKPLRLILAGVAVSALFGGAITALMVFHSDKVQGYIQWMAGGFQGRSWNYVHMILPYTIVGLICTMFAGRSLNILALGDDMAIGLGLNVQKTRFLLLTIAGFLTASSVSVAGLIGFVGLIVPHFTRLLIGSDYEVLLPISAIMGACLIVGADTVARVAMQPAEIPVGVLMTFLGAPFFLYLLRKRGIG